MIPATYDTVSLYTDPETYGIPRGILYNDSISRG